MIWVILIAVVFVVLFIMILAPKATKGYTGKKDLTNVAWAKGFKRIYFLVSGIWMFLIMLLLIMTAGEEHAMPIPAGLLFILAPIPIYYFINWIFSGFKKDKRKTK